MEFSLAAVPLERDSSASQSHEGGGPSSPPPFAESSRSRKEETAARIRKAGAQSLVCALRLLLPLHVYSPEAHASVCYAAHGPCDTMCAHSLQPSSMRLKNCLQSSDERGKKASSISAG